MLSYETKRKINRTTDTIGKALADSAVVVGVVAAGAAIGGFVLFVLTNVWAWATTDQQILVDPVATFFLNPTFPVAVATFLSAVVVGFIGYGLTELDL